MYNNTLKTTPENKVVLGMNIHRPVMFQWDVLFLQFIQSM